MPNDAEDAANAGKAVVSIATELMKAAEDNSDVQQAGKNLARAFSSRQTGSKSSLAGRGE
jgi:hypothetical protein